MRIRLVPSDTPKAITVTAIVLFFMFLATGLAATVHLAVEFPHNSPVWSILFFIVLAVGAFYSVIYTWQLLKKSGFRASVLHAAKAYQSQGFSRDLAKLFDTAQNSSEQEILIRGFLLSMAEEFEDAERALSVLDQSHLLMRPFAMAAATRLRCYHLTGRQDKTERLLKSAAEKIEAAYEMKPDFLEKFYPFLDDALEYYLIAFDRAMQKDAHEAAEGYLKKALFRISLRDTADTELMPQILDVRKMYACGQLVEAHEAENGVRGAIMQYPGITQPHRDDLLRMLEQSKLAARKFVARNDASVQGRILPEAIEAHFFGETPDTADTSHLTAM